MEWHPIKLTAPVRTYAFGARLIPEWLGKTDLPEGIVAETWEVSDYHASPSTVTSGPYAGRLLHDLVENHPAELVGAGWRGPHFPLLAKFLDASHMLPVHLHADDETAARIHNAPNGKTEAWHILWAGPNASILAGIKPGVGEDELRAAFNAQDYDAVMPRYPIQAGDTVYVPGGVIHSFGPDTLIFEIQQTSDLGQSVMPADLYGNRHGPEQWQSNIDATLAELRTDPLPKPNPGLERPSPEPGNRLVIGGAGPHFALERWTLSEPHREPARPDRCLVLSNVGDPVQLGYAAGEETLERAASCILPAALGAVTIRPPSGGASLIACYVPDLQRDIIAPLRAAGHGDDAIRSLGEVTL
ncbi:MAG: class I mannose-6-phosphate isomerase [Chloroflexota bacterium]|nr:class I mannose-6-phosphate isomerase [Chloroflexota bacterium]